MPSFLEDIRPFYGTGVRNAAGQTLEEFLDAYDPDKYRTPSCTTDAVIFSYRRQQDLEDMNLKVLLVKRSNHPSIGYWALPGGFINMRENLEDTAKRELEEETGVTGVRMEQIASYGDYGRDPRTRVITTAYMALVQEEEVTVQAGDDAADAAWCHIRVEKLTDEEEQKTADMTKQKLTEVTEQKAAETENEKSTYRLHLVNDSKGLDTTAIVEYRFSGNLIREESYTVKEQGMVAVDHAAILVQAYSLLKSRICR